MAGSTFLPLASVSGVAAIALASACNGVLGLDELPRRDPDAEGAGGASSGAGGAGEGAEGALGGSGATGPEAMGGSSGEGGAEATSGGGGDGGDGGSTGGSAASPAGGAAGATEPGGNAGAGGGPGDATIAECDHALDAASFIYVDAEFVGGSNGSRTAPFATYDEALTAAASGGARGIVIAGSPTFSEPLSVQNGISVCGGFASYPDFEVDPRERPSFEVDDSHVADNQLVGARARDIDAVTVLHGVSIQTADLTGNSERRGTSNVGLLVTGSPGFRVSNTVIVAGKAGAGAAGADGAPTTIAHNGGSATTQDPGAPSSLCNQACTVQAAFQVANQGDNRCGFGGAFEPSGTAAFPDTLTPRSGNPGTSDDSVPGGKAGVTSYDNSSCNLPDADPGLPGADGENGPRGADGAPSARASVTDEGVIEPAVGEDGGAGVRGSWGGGGGGGGTFMDGCTNDPMPGATGGGGGAPGCGGDFGRGAGGGGTSIGVLVIDSKGFSFSAGSTVTSGDAGNGGDGGTASEGGKGGAGAVDLCPENARAGCGGDGGPGGDGGRGGHGGAGTGGDSVAVYCIDTELTLDDVTLANGEPGAAGKGALSAQDGEVGEAAASVGCGG